MNPQDDAANEDDKTKKRSHRSVQEKEINEDASPRILVLAEEEEEEEVEMLRRVRSRFARTGATKMCTILVRLLPKLLQRLEQYRNKTTIPTIPKTKAGAVGVDAVAATSITTARIRQAQTLIYEILTTMIERIKHHQPPALLSNTTTTMTTTTTTTFQIIQAILPYLDSENPIVCTWTVSFIQTLLQHRISSSSSSNSSTTRATKTIPTEAVSAAAITKTPTPSSLTTTTTTTTTKNNTSNPEDCYSCSSLLGMLVPALLRSLDKLHTRLLLHEQRKKENDHNDGDDDDDDESNNSTLSTARRRLALFLTPLETHWIRVSWLLLDCFVLNSDEKPMMMMNGHTGDTSPSSFWGLHLDDVDEYSNHSRKKLRQILDQDTSNDNYGRDRSEELLSNIMKADTTNGSYDGLFHLVLDLLLFWPSSINNNNSNNINSSSMKLSSLGLRRMNYRNDITAATTAVASNIDNNDEDIRRRRRRQRRRRATTTIGNNPTTEWPDSSKVYLRHMKLICLELLLIWPPPPPSPPPPPLAVSSNHEGSKNQGTRSNSSTSSNSNSNRALLLSILMIAESDAFSIHGQLAQSYWKKWKSLMLPPNSNTANLNTTNTNSTMIPMDVTASILILIIGEERGRGLLNRYSSRETSTTMLDSAQAYQYSTLFLLGNTNNSSNSNATLYRPTLPLSMASRLASFLVKNLSIRKTKKRERAQNKNEIIDQQHRYYILFIEFSLILAEINNDTTATTTTNTNDSNSGYVFLSIRLVSFFHQTILQLQQRRRSSSLSEIPAVVVVDVILDTVLISKIFDAITKILKILIDFNEGDVDESRTIDGDPQATRRQIPLGVPSPFIRRNDLNQLLQTHRLSQKRRNNMNRDDAIQGREAAYKLIVQLSSNVFDCRTTDDDNSSYSPFQLPDLLLKCAVYEDRYLENYAIEALDAILIQYTKKLKEDQSLYINTDDDTINCTSSVSLQQQAISLLPSLLESICSGKVGVRISSIQWIHKLLLHMDTDAARYFASYLIHDDNHIITKTAQLILNSTSNSTNTNDPSQKQQHDTNSSTTALPRTDLPVSFVDVSSNDGIIQIQNELDRRINILTHHLQLAPSDQGDSQQYVASVLLMDHNFSVSKAEYEYRTNTISCLDRCGLPTVMFDNDGNIKNDDGGKVVSINTECGICYDEMEENRSYCIPCCGHTFCRTCWTSYLTKNSFLSLLNLRCPQHGCDLRVTTDDLQQLVPTLVPTWKDALVHQFIEIDPGYRFCPGPDCKCAAMKTSNESISATIVVQVEGLLRSEKVTCNTCNTSFCFGCGQNDHVPASCIDMAQWNRTVGDSRFWIKKNSKP